jgi:hypothetical protein
VLQDVKKVDIIPERHDKQLLVIGGRSSGLQHRHALYRLSVQTGIMDVPVVVLVKKMEGVILVHIDIKILSGVLYQHGGIAPGAAFGERAATDIPSGVAEKIPDAAVRPPENILPVMKAEHLHPPLFHTGISPGHIIYMILGGAFMAQMEE